MSMEIKLIEKGRKIVPDFIISNSHMTSTILGLYVTDVMPNINDYIKFNEAVYQVKDRIFDADTHHTFLLVNNVGTKNFDL